MCRVGVGAGHVCRGAMPSSRDDLRLLVPSDGRGLRQPSTCTEDGDDAPPLSALVEDDEVPAAEASAACPEGGLNQFAIMRLMKATAHDSRSQPVCACHCDTRSQLIQPSCEAACWRRLSERCSGGGRNPPNTCNVGKPV